MYINKDSISDTNMRYRGCLVTVKGQLVKINEIHAVSKDTADFTGYPWSKFGFGPYRRYKVPIKEVNYDKVPPQYVNFLPSKGCGLIRRLARRSVYSLGTKQDNTIVQCMGNLPRARVDLLPYAITRVGKPYLERERAYSQIELGISPARALSKRIALVKFENKILLYLVSNPVGEVINQDTVEVKYKHKYFKEEIEELGFTVNLLEESNAETI